jgi:hypothetical protein
MSVRVQLLNCNNLAANRLSLVLKADVRIYNIKSVRATKVLQN